MIITVMISSTIIHVSYKADNITNSLRVNTPPTITRKQNTGKQRHVNNFKE